MIKNSLLRLNNAYKKYGKDIKFGNLHKEAINDWFKRYESGKLKNETSNYMGFNEIILKKLLGYKVELDFKFSYPLGPRNVEFMIMKNGEPYIPIELKGADVNLDKPYHGGLSPVEQASNYANKKESIKWFIVSNYYEFRLYNHRSQDKYIQFNLDDLKHNENTLKDFLLVFSKQSTIIKDILDKLYDKDGLFAADYKLENEFYKLYSQTRLMLIKELEHVNPITLDEAITYAQLILNRYIFICFAEDKNLLPDETSTKEILLPIRNHNIRRNEIWYRINGLFIDLYDGNPEKGITDYNGGLFIEDLSHLKIRDKIEDPNFYKDITIKYNFPEQKYIITNELKQYPQINQIYHNLLVISSFDFDSEIDVNILGHIFENSISDIEHLKEENTSKRKKDGVYYTPETITRIICENTIIRKLMKTPSEENSIILLQENSSKSLIKQLIEEYEEELDILEDKLKKLRICDPACGSGAFLNKATDILLDIHRAIHKMRTKSYNKENLKEIFNNIDNRRKILLNNIYGVDINKESIELTKLGLFLKVAQKGIKLPNLDKNIKCGNSLIDDSNHTDHPFNWEEEFKEVMTHGGFDIIIGNPPYVRQEKIKEYKPYFSEHYTVHTGVNDLYTYFFEKGLTLLKEDGYLGFISSNTFTRVNYGRKLREFLLQYNITNYIDFTGLEVFHDVSVDSSIIIINKNRNNEDILVNKRKTNFKLDQNRLNEDAWTFTHPKILNLRDKIFKKGIPLKKLSDININRGILTGLDEAFIINKKTYEELISKDPKNTEIIKPVLRGRDVKRYNINKEEGYIIFTRNGIDIKEYPIIHDYLYKFHEKLTPKNEDQKIGRKPGKYEWYEIQDTVNYYEEFQKPKIIYPEISSGPGFTIDKNGYYPLKTLFILTLKDNSIDLYYLLTLLNSNLIHFQMRFIASKLGNKTMQYSKIFMEQLPLIIPSLAEQKILGKYGIKILDLHKKISNEKTSFQKYLISDFKVGKLTKKLLSYWSLSFDELYKEVKKQNKKITRKEKDLLEEEYQSSLNIIQPLKNEITSNDKEINKLVYELYELTDEEINLIEKK
ncbi:MAG: N-6 DNA methylase [Methanobrevibacter sp.]|jgi:hypothetical protein|nr:N-6 DNA methylase [Candidatus Methanovirga basalitermitum]